MKRKLDDYIAEARPSKASAKQQDLLYQPKNLSSFGLPQIRFKINSEVQDLLQLHFYVGNYDDPDIAEELAPLPSFEQAMLDGSEQEFRNALATLPDLNKMIGDWEDDEVEETVLMIAISRGFTEIAKELIPKVDLKIYSSESQHALHYACEYNNEEVAFAIIDLMKDNKAYLNALDSDFMTPLFYAAWNGSANICKKLRELDAKTRFWKEDKYGVRESDPQVSAEYLAASSLDVETFKVFVDSDMIRECGDLETSFKNNDDYVRYLMACTLVEPFLLQDLNFPKQHYGNDVTRITTDGLCGDESAEPSVEEGRQLFSASCSFELMDLCHRFFPDNIEYQYYLWKYAIGSKPITLHAIILGDIDMLKYLISKFGPSESIWADLELNSELVQNIIDAVVVHDNVDLVKYVCEDLKLLDLLNEAGDTFEMPDATLQIRKYLKEKGGLYRGKEEGMQIVEHFQSDLSLALHDDSYFDRPKEKEDIEEDEDLQQESDLQEGPLMQLTNDTLIEILSNVNAFNRLGDVCQKFKQIISMPFFWTRYWTKRVEFAVISPAADWPNGILDWLFTVRTPELIDNDPTTIKLANICATEGTYCYEVISLSTGKKELIERTFSETDPFVTCKEGETINFGDISPIASSSGCPALYDAHKVAQFIPSGKITLKTIHLKPTVEMYRNDEDFIKICQI